MILQAALFVSKRLQRIALALICLAAVQLAGAVAEGAKPPPGAVRVALRP
jgi:hypothetical protein